MEMHFGFNHHNPDSLKRIALSSRFKNHFKHIEMLDSCAVVLMVCMDHRSPLTDENTYPGASSPIRLNDPKLQIKISVHL